VFRAVARIFRTPDLRRKIGFTILIVAIFRLGSFIPAPFVDFQNVQTCLAANSNTSGLYELVNLFSGGALLQLSIFALGIMPYITASIIVQLLRVVIPHFDTLYKEGQSGQSKLTQYTRYLTIGLGVLQSTTLITVARSGALFGTSSSTPQCSQLITDAARFPSALSTIWQSKGFPIFLLTVGVGIVIMGLVVFVEQSQRRIPVQYAKRMVGRRTYGGNNTYIPIKVNMAGVVPVIFASSLLYIPALIAQFNQPKAGATGKAAVPAPWVLWITDNLTKGDGPYYMILYFLLIVGFTYFYVAITFNPEEVADNMKKYGGFIPGIRAGRPTAEYLDYVLTRITLPGSLYLGVIALIPLIALGLVNAAQNFPFGGTSILIIVGVGLETVKQIDSQLQQRHYEGLLR
jgi:preprotein translocase subunit SecY